MPQSPRSVFSAAAVRRYASWLVVVVSAVLLYRALPMDQAVAALQHGVTAAGPWGPWVFGAVYVLACVLLIPASLLTLAAGAVFGLGLGLVTVSLASITAATLSFFIARFVARNKVEAKARSHAGFAALDQAVGQDGWKIVAMLRLSPVIPFGIQNYLLGVTGVGWRTYMFTSWVAMVPGTVMYVYLGVAGGQAVGVAPRTGRWALFTVGLAATIALTVYLTAWATRTLRAQVEAGQGNTPDPAGGSATTRSGVAWKTPALAVVAAVMAGGATLLSKPLAGLFGPPAVTMKESYLTNQTHPSVDHSVFNALLTEHVNSDGGVDYAGLIAKQPVLDAYLATVARAPFEAMGRDEKLALLINGYNAATLRLMTEYPGIDSIRSIPADKRWDDVRWVIGGTRYSLSQIEHEAIRPHFIEPRVHWALVCAAVDCPPLRSEAYTAARLDEQLDSQARTVFTRGKRWFEVGPDTAAIRVSAIMQWYGTDFEQASGGVAAHVAGYDPAVRAAHEAGRPPQVGFLDYVWLLNSVENVRAVTDADGVLSSGADG